MMISRRTFLAMLATAIPAARLAGDPPPINANPITIGELADAAPLAAMRSSELASYAWEQWFKKRAGCITPYSVVTVPDRIYGMPLLPGAIVDEPETVEYETRIVRDGTQIFSDYTPVNPTPMATGEDGAFARFDDLP